MIEHVERGVFAGEDAKFEDALGGLFEIGLGVGIVVEDLEGGLELGLGFLAVPFFDDGGFVFVAPIADGGFANADAGADGRRLGEEFGHDAIGDAAFKEGENSGLLFG